MGSYTLTLMPHITPKVDECLAAIRDKSAASRGTVKTFDRNLAIYRNCVHEHHTLRSVARRFKLSVRTVEEILMRVRKLIQTIERKIAEESAVA